MAEPELRSPDLPWIECSAACDRHWAWSISSRAACCSATRSGPAPGSPGRVPARPGSRRRDGVLNVWVAPIDESDGVDWAAARAVTDDTDRGIRMFGWAWDGRHLLYVQDAGGDENWRLYDVDLVTAERRDLTPFEKIHAQIIGSTSGARPRCSSGSTPTTRSCTTCTGWTW